MIKMTINVTGDGAKGYLEDKDRLNTALYDVLSRILPTNHVTAPVKTFDWVRAADIFNRHITPKAYAISRWYDPYQQRWITHTRTTIWEQFKPLDAKLGLITNNAFEYALADANHNIILDSCEQPFTSECHAWTNNEIPISTPFTWPDHIFESLQIPSRFIEPPRKISED